MPNPQDAIHISLSIFCARQQVRRDRQSPYSTETVGDGTRRDHRHLFCIRVLLAISQQICLIVLRLN